MRNLFIILLFLSLGTQAQVVNIEQERMDTTGINGMAQVSFQYIKNKSEVFNVGGDVHFQYKTKKSTLLSITSYTLSKTAAAEYANAGVQHFRYNYKIGKRISSEIFTQGQFNKMLNVNFRWLIGAGPRIRIIKTDPLKSKFGDIRMYTGLLYMYEYEELTNDVYHRDHRLSSYVSLYCKLGKNLSVSNTTYYQPKFVDWNDYRVSSQTDVKVYFAKRFGFKLSYLYFIDTHPAEGVPKETHNFINSLIYDF